MTVAIVDNGRGTLARPKRIKNKKRGGREGRKKTMGQRGEPTRNNLIEVFREGRKGTGVNVK